MPTARQPGRFHSTLELLARRWQSAGPLLAGFPLLARGEPLEVEEIATAAGLEIARVAAAVDAASCERDAKGRLIDLYGLTLTPTLHRLRIGPKILFSCCALWAHVVPKLLGNVVRIESVDPLRHELVRLTVSPAGVEAADPAGASATLAVASREEIAADVGRAFCGSTRHFVSRQSAEQFAADRANCHSVGLAELQSAAEQLHQAIWRAVA